MTNNHQTKIFIVLVVIAIAFIGLAAALLGKGPDIVPQSQVVSVKSFDECVAAGNPIMESFPRKCSADGVTFTKEVKGVTDMSDQIHITSPAVEGIIDSPLVIKGEVRGNWFSEAVFPVTLTNWDGLIIAEGQAKPDGDWMTTDFVPFTATLTFTKPDFNNRGFLILKKDNPSDLPENAASLEIPIYFNGVAPQGAAPTPPPIPEGVACTMEAKQCPDGSYVGRQGPKCEFAPCPGN